jgi:hypothetical protein
VCGPGLNSKRFELTQSLTFHRLVAYSCPFLGTSRSLAEDNLNISLKDITVTGRDGRVSQLDQVYIRGSMIRFFIVPDMLQNAPMLVVLCTFHRICDSLRNLIFLPSCVSGSSGLGLML